LNAGAFIGGNYVYDLLDNKPSRLDPLTVFVDNLIFSDVISYLKAAIIKPQLPRFFTIDLIFKKTFLKL
jgi:hypothetical protein